MSHKVRIIFKIKIVRRLRCLTDSRSHRGKMLSSPTRALLLQRRALDKETWDLPRDRQDCAPYSAGKRIARRWLWSPSLLCCRSKVD